MRRRKRKRGRQRNDIMNQISYDKTQVQEDALERAQMGKKAEASLIATASFL